MKLTPKQNEVIYLLQNGEILITDSDTKGALLTNSTKTINGSIRLNNRIFWNLVDKDLIYQGSWMESRCSFILTKKGKEIKTKTPKL